ncbi:hypothetical protein AUEXF2481DRAFT_478782 [Aureobasidium subglaciale EXF-2481]|uniref:F-box domain-containing protein n=1 Tax=Aureobasidium subglaciale (strain EXF-2481) TaxID=1043005 RepID=A0A074YKG1_AURSE|nr:uncharacterized protein AUEXF2481DRAFT_478782 [Aureobasidium subglaciale EXF-2481]KEQ98313.1 hypothetical protein AUEXF2481DRAFT_478782 [Aureobasidium subglaciale EXF-2481]
MAKEAQENIRLYNTQSAHLHEDEPKGADQGCMRDESWISGKGRTTSSRKQEGIRGRKSRENAFQSNTMARTSPGFTESKVMDELFVRVYSLDPYQPWRHLRCATPPHNNPDITNVPTEILVKIFSLVEPADVPKVRLTCKKLCDAANRPFSFEFITGRIHEVTPMSIKKLLDITDHPIFGGYVKAVTFASARHVELVHKDELEAFSCRRRHENRQRDLSNAYVHTKRFAHRMERIFRNIKARSGCVTIAVQDFNTKNGSKPVIGGNSRRVLEEATRTTYLTAKTLEQVVYAARRARCPIECLRTDIWPAQSLTTVLPQILESCIMPMSVQIGNKFEGTFYDSKRARLDITHGGTFNVDGDTLVPGRTTELLIQWVKEKNISELALSDCKIRSRFSTRSFLASCLSRLEFDVVECSSDSLDANGWGDHIQRFSNLPGLVYCRMNRVSYRMNRVSYHASIDFDIIGNTMQLIIGNGRYATKSAHFDLYFRDGSRRFESSGDGVCAELKSLACYVKAAEADKRQRIIADGRVDDCIIGIIDQVEE